MLIGVCESGVFSPSIALLADKLAPERRPWGMSIYMGGQVFAYSGFVLAVGYVTEHFGWRAAFFTVGGLAAFVACFLFIFVTDRRSDVSSPASMSLRSVLNALKAKRSFVHLTIALTLYLVVDSAASNWIPAFLSRSLGRDVETPPGSWPWAPGY